MSQEGAKALLKKAASDAAFRTALEKAPTPADKQKLLKANGFEVTLADLAAVTPKKSGGELSDKELEAVAGGSVAGWISVGTAVLGAAAAAAA